MNRVGPGGGWMLRLDRDTDACSLFSGCDRPKTAQAPQYPQRPLPLLPLSPPQPPRRPLPQACPIPHLPSEKTRARRRNQSPQHPRSPCQGKAGSSSSSWALSSQHIPASTCVVLCTQGKGKMPEARVRFLSLEFAALFLLQVAAGERKMQPPR